MSGEAAREGAQRVSPCDNTCMNLTFPHTHASPSADLVERLRDLCGPEEGCPGAGECLFHDSATTLESVERALREIADWNCDKSDEFPCGLCRSCVARTALGEKP